LPHQHLQGHLRVKRLASSLFVSDGDSTLNAQLRLRLFDN
jgi:hypothetical protein